MKRWISFLLALTLIVGMLPATPIHVHAAEHEDEVVVDETTISATEPAKEETTPPIMEASEEEALLPAALDSSRAADSGAIPVLLGVNVGLNGNDILDTSDGWLPYLAIKSPVFEPGTGTANVEIKNSVLYTNGSLAQLK